MYHVDGMKTNFYNCVNSFLLTIHSVPKKMSLSCLGPLEKVTFFMGHCVEVKQVV